ncbi:PREDICTED: ALK tyrosine kinase receptor [Crocodylus porosus]|uniref:ALK tyrosine kinase receptor n=1 Tax=Crocodylus porosus TaxID=8502 RepID=UPI00093C5857|nr:PREDICTED: ALK tyrosine kinase receptor [Crocodylus porosus]
MWTPLCIWVGRQLDQHGMLEGAATGEGLNTLESPTNSPPLPSDHSAWNLTWVMKDSSPFSHHRGQHNLGLRLGHF